MHDICTPAPRLCHGTLFCCMSFSDRMEVMSFGHEISLIGFVARAFSLPPANSSKKEVLERYEVQYVSGGSVVLRVLKFPPWIRYIFSPRAGIT